MIILRRFPRLLLPLLIAAYAVMSLSDLAAAQTPTPTPTPPPYYNVPIAVTGGTNYGDAGSIVCNSGPGVTCSANINHWAYIRAAGMQSVYGVFPSWLYTGTGHTIRGFWADYTLTWEHNPLYIYIADTDFFAAQGSGTESGRMCIAFDLPAGVTQEMVFSGVGCTRYGTGSGANRDMSLQKLAGPSKYWIQGIDSKNSSFSIYNLHIRTLQEPPTPPPPTQPPGTSPGGGAGTCVLTITITNTAGITNTQFPTGTITGTIPISPVTPITQTFVYTRNMNLVDNSSFEQADGGGPANWGQVQDGAFRNYDWSDWWKAGAGRTGARYMLSGYPFDLYQSVFLHGPHAHYAVGAHTRCGSEGCNDNWNIYLDLMFGIYAPNPELIAMININSDEYQVFSGTTRSRRAGAMRVFVRPLGNGAYLDDVFVYPVEDDGITPICLPEYYAPPGPDDGLPPGYTLPPGVGGPTPTPGGGTQPIGGIPGPITGAGAICYYCFAPQDLSVNGVSYWVAWLGCVIRNMFACSLRVWLMYVMNTTYGVFQVLYAFLSWVPAQAQAAVTWAAMQIQQTISWIASDVVPGIAINIAINNEAGTSLWDVLIALIQMINGILGGLLALLGTLVTVIGGMISALAAQLLGIARLLVELALALPRAMAAEPYVFDISGGSDPHAVQRLDAEALTAVGSNDQKIVWIVLAFAGVVDQMMGGGGAVVLTVAVAAIGFGVILWTLNHWRDLISF